MNRVIGVNNLSPELHFSEDAIERLFYKLDAFELYKIPTGDLSIAFMNNDRIAQLHADYLDDPTPTDVITFPGDIDMDFAGEICVSAEQANIIAPQENNSLSEEITLYLVHGWLHLAGLDDKNDADRQEMRAAEHQVMEFLRHNNHIPLFSLKPKNTC